jgi:hypothetical protein
VSASSSSNIEELDWRHGKNKDNRSQIVWPRLQRLEGWEGGRREKRESRGKERPEYKRGETRNWERKKVSSFKSPPSAASESERERECVQCAGV